MADGFQGASVAASVVSRLQQAGVAASVRDLPPWPSVTPEVGTAICIEVAGAPRPIALAGTWHVRSYGPLRLRQPSWTWGSRAFPLDAPARIPDKRMARVLATFAETWAADEASLGLLQVVFALKDSLSPTPGAAGVPPGNAGEWCALVLQDEAWIGVERGGRRWPAFLHIRSTGQAFEIVYPGAGPDDGERRWRVATRGDLAGIAAEVNTYVATLAAWCVQFVAQRRLLESFAERLCVELDSQQEGPLRCWRAPVATTDTFEPRVRPRINVKWHDEHLSGGSQLSVDDTGHLVLDGTSYPDDTPMTVLQQAITVSARGVLVPSPGDEYRLKRALGEYEVGVVFKFLRVGQTEHPDTMYFAFEVVEPGAGRGPERLDGTHRYRGLTLSEDSPDEARVMAAMGDWFEPVDSERDAQARRVDLLVDIGTYLREHGALAPARDRLDAARALDPNHPVAAFQLGWVAAQDDRWADALVFFSRAAELDPTGVFPKNNQAWALGRLGRFHESLAILDALVQSSPDFAEAHRNRGWVLHNLGRPEEARTACEQAVALSPTYVGGLHEAGVVAIGQKRWEDAVAYLERAVALAPSDTAIGATLLAARAGKA